MKHGRRAASIARRISSPHKAKRVGRYERLGDLSEAHQARHLLRPELLLIGEPRDQRCRRPIEPLDGVFVD